MYIVSYYRKRLSIFCSNSSFFITKNNIQRGNFKAQFHGFIFLSKYGTSWILLSWIVLIVHILYLLPYAAERSKSHNLFERTKEDIESVIHKQKKSPHGHGHHKETHGTSNDIDENTPIDEVKGPSVFQRAKEELEAILDAIHPKKDSSRHSNPLTNKEDKEEEEEGGGFKVSLGKGLEKICSPMNHHHHSRD